MAQPEKEVEAELARIDIYRHTPIRLLGSRLPRGMHVPVGLAGYANEVGEAFRSLVPVNVVRFSYVISTAYVCADTFDKSQRTYRVRDLILDSESQLFFLQLPFSSSTERRKQVALTAADTLIWQGFASVIVPGITINRLCALSLYLLRK